MTYAEKLSDPQWHKRSGIYKIIINTELYIGSAVDLPKRLRQHLCDLKTNRHSNIHLQRAFNKYKEIDFDVIEVITDVKKLITSEQYYIDSLKPHYNISPTAGSQLGFTHSDATKKKISALQIGRVISIETRIKMSGSQKGKIRTEEQKRKYSESKKGDKNPFYKCGSLHPQYGLPKSEETRKRISETSKLRLVHSGMNNAASKSGVLYDVDTGKNYVFQSLKPLCEKLGLRYKGIHSAMRNKKFYLDRYYTDYVFVPSGTYTRL